MTSFRKARSIFREAQQDAIFLYQTGSIAKILAVVLSNRGLISINLKTFLDFTDSFTAAFNYLTESTSRWLTLTIITTGCRTTESARRLTSIRETITPSWERPRYNHSSLVF